MKMNNKQVIQSYPYHRVSEEESVFYSDGNEWQNAPRYLYGTFWSRIRYLGVAIGMLILFILWVYQTPREYPHPDLKRPFPIIETEQTSEFEHTAMKSLGGKIDCDAELIAPSKTVPMNVNEVRPADIKVLASLGDSITVASGSKNFDDEPRDIYVGNSLFIGGDEDISRLTTLGNILKNVNPNLIGLSHGQGEALRGFNVAVGGMTAEDLPRQAGELVMKVLQNKLVDNNNDWKLVTIFIGTNDIGKLNCYTNKTTVSYELYKTKLEETLNILQHGLPRTIVSILAMWNSQLTIEAKSLIFDGQRKSCGEGTIEARDTLIDSYRRAAYELQNEKKFNNNNFTVVTQSFLDDIKDSFRNKAGQYDKSFYADDVFHLSKYGNSIFGKYLWNGLLEPVGKKNTKAELNNDDMPLICPDKDAPFIRTLGNS